MKGNAIIVVEKHFVLVVDILRAMVQ